MRGKLNYRQLWLDALRQGEVRVNFPSEVELNRRRQGFYTSIRPFRTGERKHPELERAAHEVTLFVPEGQLTIVLQHFSRALGRVPTVTVAGEGLSPTQVPEMTSSEAERIAAMAQAALEKVARKGGKSTPYYTRGEEENE